MRTALLLLLLSACTSSTEPSACNGKGSYAGADACARMKAAFDPKCPGIAFDCVKFLEGTQCKAEDSFCSEGVDTAATDLSGAASCEATSQVNVSLRCY
jgi:hypothetical protein